VTRADLEGRIPSMNRSFGDYIATDLYAVIQAHRAIAEMGDKEKVSALLLDGPPGTGKTFLARTVARYLDAKLLHFQFFPGCGRGDLLWDISDGRDGGRREDGIILRALRMSRDGKVVLLLDELDKAAVEVDSFLLNFLNEGHVYVRGEDLVEANRDNLIVCITKNDQRGASHALLRRCRCVLMDWPSVETETAIMRKLVPALTDEACAVLLEIPTRLRRNPEVRKPPSTPEICRAVGDLLELVSRGCRHDILGEYYVSCLCPLPEDRRWVEKSPAYVGLSVREALQGLPAERARVAGSPLSGILTTMMEGT
jgi:hypothetical protein